MAKKASARRYAQAVFEIALERNELDKWQADLEELAALGKDTAAVELLESPRLRFSDKTKLLSGVVEDVGPLARNLVYLLVQRNILSILDEIAHEYQHLLDEYRGVDRAQVLTAVALDEDEKRKLEAELGLILGKKVIIQAQVDPDVIGGIVARVEGKLLDASVRSRLVALKNEIASPSGTGRMR